MQVQFKLNPFRGQIDTENRQIKNVIVAEAGEAKGHGYSIDEEFLDDIVKYGKRYGKKGVKSRFDHPAWGDGSMGLQLGRMNNFRREGNRVLADLEIYMSADKSPSRPNMGSWLLSIAEEDSEAVMVSIVFYLDHYYQRINGTKKKVYYYDDQEGWINPLKGEPVYVKMASLEYADIVESGAVTESMFREQAANFSKLHKDHSMKITKTLSAIWAFFGFSENQEEAELNSEHLKTLNEELSRKSRENLALTEQLGEKGDKLKELTGQLEAREAELAETRGTAESNETALNERVNQLSEKLEKLENQLTSFQGNPKKEGNDPAPNTDGRPSLNYV